MVEETANVENVENAESGQSAARSEKIFTLEILPMIRHAQQQHGLRHGDYQRYRGYCTRRLSRLRKALKYPQGDKRHFKRRDVTCAQLTGKNADERFIHIPLISAERAWAYAMQLKQEANTEPRKRFHLIHKLRKACVYALQLQELCKSEVFTARAKLEAEAYVAWMHGSLHFELQLWQTSGEHLKRAQLVYEQLAQALPEDEQELYRSKVNEFLPNLRYCAYNISSGGNANAASAAGSNVDELLGMHAQGLLDNLEVLVSQTKMDTSEFHQTFDWRGTKITVRSEKVRRFLVSDQELDKTLEKSSAEPEERIALIERVLLDCKDTIQVVKDEARMDLKVRQGGPGASMQTLLSYLYYLRHKRTLQRNLCLVEQAKTSFEDPNNKSDVQEVNETPTKAKSKKGMTLSMSSTGDGKRVRAQDLARLYEIILQNVNEMQNIQRVEDDAAYQIEVQTLANTFKAFRCYYIALSLIDMKKWREAVALYERSTNYAQEALKNFVKPEKDEFHMAEPLRQLLAKVEGCKFSAHAYSVLEEEPLNEANSTSSFGKSTQKLSKPLYERLGQYKEDQSLHTRKPNVFNLVPDFEPIPCKPLFFDLALNYVELPSLEDKLESSNKQGGASISGFVKGFLGWGGNK